MAPSYTTGYYYQITLSDRTSAYTTNGSSHYAPAIVKEPKREDPPPPPPVHRFPEPVMIAERTRPEWVALHRRVTRSGRR